MEGLYLVLKIVGILAGLFIIFTLWCCCKVSGNSNKRDEELEMLHKNNNFEKLTDLEKQTVERLKEEFSSCLLFEPNNNENITIEECEDKFKNGKFTILKSGKCIGFTI